MNNFFSFFSFPHKFKLHEKDTMKSKAYLEFHTHIVLTNLILYIKDGKYFFNDSKK